MSLKKSKWFKKDNFIVLILVGVLLFVIALPIEDAGTSKGREEEESESQSSILTLSRMEERSRDSVPASTYAEGDTDEAYALYLEERLKEALSQMAEVGQVEVMITLQSSRELVVEKEQPVMRSTTNESDSQGGSRVVNELDSEENTVYRTDGSISEPYVVKTLTPRIEGVLVVAQGAGSGTVSHTIVEIVQTLFGVDAHKVKVVKMGIY